MNFIFRYLTPVNFFTVLGLFLMILGFILFPFFIGLPIFIFGTILLIGAIFWYFFDYLPGGKILKNYLKSLFKKGRNI